MKWNKVRKRAIQIQSTKEENERQNNNMKKDERARDMDYIVGT